MRCHVRLVAFCFWLLLQIGYPCEHFGGAVAATRQSKESHNVVVVVVVDSCVSSLTSDDDGDTMIPLPIIASCYKTDFKSYSLRTVSFQLS